MTTKVPKKMILYPEGTRVITVESEVIEGVVIAVFTNRDGIVHYVVEDDYDTMFIFTAVNIRKCA